MHYSHFDLRFASFLKRAVAVESSALLYDCRDSLIIVGLAHQVSTALTVFLSLSFYALCVALLAPDSRCI